MFCTQCGSKLLIGAKFCTNCGHKVLVQIPKKREDVVERDIASKKIPFILKIYVYLKTGGFRLPTTGEVSRRVKKRVSTVPIITAVGDAVLGASGLDDLQRRIQQDPHSAINWLFYYEAFVTYGKVKSGVNVARLAFNPVGFAVSKGITMGLNAADDNYQKFNPQICLDVGLSLASKNIRNRQWLSQNLLIAGKILFYKAINENDQDRKQNYLRGSLNYISLAIECERNLEFIAEYFFYLAQIYHQLNNEQLRLRALNLSRKFGFAPSLDLLSSILVLKGVKVEPRDSQSCPIKDFRFTYDSGSKLDKAFKYTLNEQGKKISNTARAIKKFLDT